MRNLEDNMILLGLVVTTLPFSYKDGIVSANFSASITKEELEKTKADLELMRSKEYNTDAGRQELSDEIYFINKIIESLEMK